MSALTATAAIRTASGTTVTFSQDGPDTVVHLQPATGPTRTAGRVVDGAFHPAPQAGCALAPDTLRAIAALIDYR